MKKYKTTTLMSFMFLILALSLESIAYCDFENYFKEMVQDNGDTTHLEHKVEEALHSVLKRLQVPYVGENGEIQMHGFFEEVEKKIHKKDPEAKVYAAGGVVRSLLGYIYKKVYSAKQKNANI